MGRVSGSARIRNKEGIDRLGESKAEVFVIIALLSCLLYLLCECDLSDPASQESTVHCNLQKTRCNAGHGLAVLLTSLDYFVAYKLSDK